MKTLWILLFALSVVACSDQEEMSDCSAAPAGEKAPESGRITYTADAAKGLVKSVTYQTGTGQVTVTNNSNHFQVSFPIAAGAPIAISAQGSLSKGGKLTVGYSFLNEQGGDPIVTQAACSN